MEIPERWRAIDRILELALDLPADEQSALLARECAGDDHLQREILTMIQSAGEAGGRIGRTVADCTKTLLSEQPPGGERVGPYRLIREIGSGGMGTVWLGERADGQFEQRVAVKLIAHHVAAETVRTRFLAERQILAGLDHPNIARLLDGGVTELGAPFLALEYVDGVDLREYSRGMTTSRKLDLFLAVCSAVECAHRSMVVHRDLKMSNIMVTAEGVVKLLDFGIAKVLQEAPSEQTVTSARMMTPEYASPEQVLGRPVTTLSDVYSLGVVLFVLLTDKSPYRTQRGTIEEICSAVATQEVTAPSAVSSNNALAGDLDVIALKAMQKDPSRRYQSVAQLADDIRAFLAGRPIRARPDTLSYRAAKFVRRNPWPVAAGAVLLIVLAGFAIRELEQGRRLEHERDKAEKVSAFLATILESGDASLGGGSSVSVETVLSRASQRLETEFANQSDVQLRLATVLGRAYMSLGEFDKARPLITRAMALRASVNPGYRFRSAPLLAMADLSDEMNRYAEAEKLGLEYLDEIGKTHGLRSVEVATAYDRLGIFTANQGKSTEAQHYHRQAIDLQKQLLGSTDTSVALSLGNLAVAQRFAGNFADAEKSSLESVQIYRLHGAPSQDHQQALSNHGNLLAVQGRTAEAKPYVVASVEMSRQLYGPGSLRSAYSQRILADLHMRMGEYAAAEPLMKEVLRIRETNLPKSHEHIGQSKADYGGLLLRTGRPEQALPLLREAYALQKQSKLTGGGHHAQRLADCLSELGRFIEAEKFMIEGFERLRDTSGIEHRRTQDGLKKLVAFLQKRGESKKAVIYAAMIRPSAK